MSSITVAARDVGSANEGAAAVNSVLLTAAAVLDHVWEVVSQAYPAAVRSRSAFVFELSLSGGTASTADFNSSDLTFSQYLVRLNGDVQFGQIRTLDDSAFEGNETFSFQPVLRTDNFALDVRGSSGVIARLTPAQINTLFAAAGGITFNVGTVTGTIVDNDNAAPTLSQAAFNLIDTNEDTTSTATTVAALLADAGWVDLNVSPLKGVAVTDATGRG